MRSDKALCQLEYVQTGHVINTTDVIQKTGITLKIIEPSYSGTAHTLIALISE